MKPTRFLQFLDLLGLLCVLSLIACGPPASNLATVTTTAAQAASTTAVLGGEVVNGDDIYEQGVVYSLTAINSEPAISGVGVKNVSLEIETGVGPFTFNVAGLAPSTQYSFAAYVSNRSGTSYGDVLTFTTGPDAGAVNAGFAPMISASEHMFVEAIAVQPDGKTLIGGGFETVGGHHHLNIARLLPDGNVDTNFNCRVEGEYASVAAIAVQPDGKILIGGSFKKVNGVARNCIARLNSDGSLESTSTFNPGKGADQVVFNIVVQKDGKILIGGYFENVNGQPRNYIARLNPNGSLEDKSTFDVSVNFPIGCLALQDDGQILIGGLFDTVNGVARRNLARLNPDGSLESTTTFDPGTGPDFVVQVITVQEDGQILLGGAFGSVNGVARKGIARLNPDGSVESDATFDPGAGVGGVTFQPSVLTMSVQTDGKIVIGGPFNTIDGHTRNGVARLNPDGSVEDVATFDIGSGAGPITTGGNVSAVAVQPDGKILITGSFESFNDQPARTMVLLDNDQATQSLFAPDGSEIQWGRAGAAPSLSGVTFEVSTNGGVSWTKLGNGTSVAGGWELTGLSLPADGLIRARGKIMAGYGSSCTGLVQQVSPIAGAPAVVVNPTVAVVTDGSAELGGDVTSDGGSPIEERGVIYAPAASHSKLEVDDFEDLDAVVEPYGEPVGSNGLGVFTIPVEGLELGTTYSFRAYATNGLTTSYSPVATFTTLGPPTVGGLTLISVSADEATVSAEVFETGGAPVQSRGIVLYEGGQNGADRLATGDGVRTFHNIPGSEEPGEFSEVLHTLDPGTTYTFAAFAKNAFGTGYSKPYTVTTTQQAPTDSSGTPTSGFSSAAVDTTFAPIVNGSYVQAIALTPGGQTIIGGVFEGVGGETHPGLARLNADGSIDSSFTATTNGSVFGIAVQNDGKIVVAGAFTVVNGVARNGIARLKADGTLDSGDSFEPGTGADGIIYALALQPDGKILIGGLFNNVNGAPRKNVARLNANGSLESTSTFDVGTSADDAVYSIALQTDGQILLGGAFENVNGTAQNHIARLNADGSVESSATFNPGTGADDRVFAVAVQPDGKILLGGDFGEVNGQDRNGVARLNSDGSVESTATFDPGAGADGAVLSLALQADGKILIGGSFQSVDETSRNRIARLHSDGSLDSAGGFDVGTGANGEVDAVAVLGNGRVVVGGGFTTFDGAEQSLIARINNDAATQNLTIVDPTHLQWMRGGSAPEVSGARFEVSTNGGVIWTPLGAGTRITGGWELTGQALPARGIVRALGQTTGGYLGASSGVVEHRLAFPTTVPAKDGPVTDGAGDTFASLGTPQTGAFSGAVKAGRAKAAAIFATNGRVLLQVGVDGIAKLGTLNGDAVLVTLKPGGAVTTKNNVQLTLGLSAGSPVVGAQTGTAYPGLPTGVTIKKFLTIDGQGSTTFALATLQGDGVTPKNSLALLAVTGPGSVKIVARKDQDVTIDSRTEKVATLATMVASKGTPAADRWRVDDTHFGIRVTLPSKLQANFAVPATANSSTDWVLMARTGAVGDSITGLNGATIGSFGLPGFGRTAVAQVVNLVKGGEVSARNNVGLTAGSNPAGLQLLGRKDFDARDAEGKVMIGVYYQTFGDPVSGADGSVAFTGTLAGTGVTRTNKTGLWYARDGITPKLIARAGDLAPGGGRWKEFTSLVLPDDPARGPIILGKLAVSAADGVSAKDSLRLWAMDSTGSLRLMFRSGQEATANGVTKEVKSFAALVPAAKSLGAASGYDNSGNVAVLVTFIDRTQALLVLNVP